MCYAHYNILLNIPPPPLPPPAPSPVPRPPSPYPYPYPLSLYIYIYQLGLIRRCPLNPIPASFFNRTPPNLFLSDWASVTFPKIYLGRFS